MDGDGQHDPSFVPSLIAAIQKEKTDIAIGSRFLKEAKGPDLSTYRAPRFVGWG